MSLIRKLVQIKTVLFWSVSLFSSLTSCNPNPSEQLNQLRLYLVLLSHPPLLWPNEHVIAEQQDYNLGGEHPRLLPSSSSLSSSLGRLHTGPCWTLERWRLFSWGCNIKGRWVLNKPSCFHTGLLAAAATHPYPGNRSADVRHHGPKSCPAAGDWWDSASAFGYSLRQPPHFSGPHFLHP